MLPSGLPSNPPKTLGKYEVGAKIGGGGMATVYLGRDIREDGSEELVALKVIREELAHDEQFTLMFVDEAKILARLSHPNVIQTLEYGVTGPHRFIAMELLNGRTLADAYDALVEENAKFELGVGAWICARVAEGLHSAHELVDEDGQPLNVIHRDVNPTNIFLTHSGDVKLIDFGLARARVRMSKSAEGIVKGKIPYLAPEQAHGQPIDRRIDLYALGTTLWELSTMKRLFKRDTDVDTLRAIRDAHVPDPRDTDPDFPEGLWKIIERALRTDKDERYASAEEMRADLDAFARTTGPHAPKVASLVSQLFPGGEARQAKWLRDAAAVRVTDSTMAPPAPVPIASSSLLEDDGPPSRTSVPEQPTVIVLSPRDDSPPPPLSRRASAPPPSHRSVPPSIAAESKTPALALDTKEAARDAKDSSDKKDARSKSRSGDAERVMKTGKHTRADKLKRRAKRAVVAPPEDKRTMWIIVGLVVVVLILLALLVSR